MFSKDISMEEFAYGIHIAGIARYNQFLKVFRKYNIEVSFEKLLVVVGLINEKMFEKVLEDEDVKFDNFLLYKIKKDLNETVPEDMSPEDREKNRKYIEKVSNKVNKIMSNENSTISELIDYFLYEVTSEPIEDKYVMLDLKFEFKDWQYSCYELIRKFKM